MSKAIKNHKVNDREIVFKDDLDEVLNVLHKLLVSHYLLTDGIVPTKVEALAEDTLKKFKKNNRKSSLPKITDYQMFSKEGNIACQELVDKAMEISAEDRKAFVEQGMIEIAKTHEEVYDTEPREMIYSKTKINK